jgi:lipopolysaccharide export system permease protein
MDRQAGERMGKASMKVLTRYITRTYLKLLGLVLSAFVTIYLVIELLEKISRFFQAGSTLAHVLMYFLLKIPMIVSQVMPLAVLMATLLTLGLLSRSSEIVAMQSCGFSLKTITKPLLLGALSLSLLTFIANEAVLPMAAERLRYVEEVLILDKSPSTFFRLNNIWYRDESFILRARLFIPDSVTMKGVTLWQVTENMQPASRLEAEEGIWEGSRWVLKNVVKRSFASGKVRATETIATLPIAVNLKINDLKVSDKYAEDMGFFKLRHYAEKLRKGGYDATRYLAQMHARISFPFACLIMAFVGIPFALRGGRSSGIALGIGLSIGIGFAYFIVNSALLSFGQTGVIPPVVAAWAANFIFALSAVWLTLTLHH